ncbi:MAG: metal ABC transporter permease [Flavobacteriales bacterium]|jgi:manganese/zinc/iron transport system permease protein|nr:metal ABC transporter permease [Flavobacteriales bacterium]
MVILIFIGISLLGIASGLVGSFTFLQKKALLGDAIAHAVFPGVAIGFMFSGTKDPVYLILGAIVFGFLSILSINAIIKYSKLKSDTAIALVLSVFFGLGVLFFTYIQHHYNASQTGLDKFLFGKAASMLKSDLYWLSAISLIILSGIVIFFRDFLIISFDKEYAETTGIKVKRAEFLLALFTILVIVIGVQIVGIVLMAALLLTPASTARFWTNKLSTMVILSAVFAAISGWLGVWISMSIEKMPTGPWIVISLSVISVFSILFSPKRGVLFRILKRKHIKMKMLEDNILKTFYHLAEEKQDFKTSRKLSHLMDRRFFEITHLKKGLKKLTKEQLLIKENKEFSLSSEGVKRAKRIVKLHRLWELYLSKKLRIAGDHVHDDADTIEHFINEDLEKELEAILDYPDQDPHQNKIPYH